MARAAWTETEYLESKALVARTLSMQSMAGITVAMFGVLLHEKQRVTPLKTYGECDQLAGYMFEN
jgi:hypothetical protein